MWWGSVVVSSVIKFPLGLEEACPPEALLLWRLFCGGNFLSAEVVDVCVFRQNSIFCLCNADKNYFFIIVRVCLYFYVFIIIYYYKHFVKKMHLRGALGTFPVLLTVFHMALWFCFFCFPWKAALVLLLGWGYIGSCELKPSVCLNYHRQERLVRALTCVLKEEVALLAWFQEAKLFHGACLFTKRKVDYFMIFQPNYIFDLDFACPDPCGEIYSWICTLRVQWYVVLCKTSVVTIHHT